VGGFEEPEAEDAEAEVEEAPVEAAAASEEGEQPAS
jgi:hypothetical protein